MLNKLWDDKLFKSLLFTWLILISFTTGLATTSLAFEHHAYILTVKQTWILLTIVIGLHGGIAVSVISAALINVYEKYVGGDGDESE